MSCICQADPVNLEIETKSTADVIAHHCAITKAEASQAPLQNRENNDTPFDIMLEGHVTVC